MTKHINNRSPEAWAFHDVKLETTSAHARLGMMVIAYAVHDCCDQRDGVFYDSGRKGGQIADCARSFLSTPNPELQFWCEVAGLDPGYVIRSYWTRLHRPIHERLAS